MTNRKYSSSIISNGRSELQMQIVENPHGC